MYTVQIKMFDSWFLGLRSQGDERVPLGYLTPGGKDSAAKKRMESVKGWTTQYHNSPNLQALEPRQDFKASEPVAGFKLSDSIRRSSSWNGGNVVWRIEDPRGFELEISSENLGQIMSCSTVINGEFHGKMLWARESGKNILVPVSSDVYKKAVEDTAVASAKTTSINKIPVGTWVTLKNGVKAQYLGKFLKLVTDSDRPSYRRGDRKTWLKVSEIHILAGKPYSDSHPNFIEYADPRVVSTHEKEPFISEVHFLRQEERVSWQSWLPFKTVKEISYSTRQTADGAYPSQNAPSVDATGIFVSEGINGYGYYYQQHANRYEFIAKIEFTDGTTHSVIL